MPRLNRCEMTIRNLVVHVQLTFSTSNGEYKYRKQIYWYFFQINIISGLFFQLKFQN